MTENLHKAGFVGIIGRPNVGKSTLMNALVGERLSIVTSKAQTTRHRIMGIISGPDYQIVYSDTPGIIEPKYELQKSMMKFVQTSLEDSDIVLFVTELGETFEEKVLEKIRKVTAPILLIINKVDTAKSGQEVLDKIEYWKTNLKAVDYVPVSALEKYNVENVLAKVVEHLPSHLPYFDKDQLTDKPERFFAAEIIREKIFLNYEQEVPYSTEVVITDFNEEPAILRIRAEIIVERDSQKGIIIGKKGEALKRVGIESRKEMELFFAKKVFLEQYVKVEPDWRKKENKLRHFGYNQ